MLKSKQNAEKREFLAITKQVNEAITHPGHIIPPATLIEDISDGEQLARYLTGAQLLERSLMESPKVGGCEKGDHRHERNTTQ